MSQTPASSPANLLGTPPDPQEFIAPIEFFEAGLQPHVCLVTGATAEVLLFKVSVRANEGIKFRLNPHVTVLGHDLRPMIEFELPFTPKGYSEYCRSNQPQNVGWVGCLLFFTLLPLLMQGFVMWAPVAGISPLLAALQYSGYGLLSLLLTSLSIEGINMLLRFCRWNEPVKKVSVQVRSRLLPTADYESPSPARWRGTCIDSTPGRETSYEVFEEIQITLRFLVPQTAADLHARWMQAYEPWRDAYLGNYVPPPDDGDDQ